MILISEQKIKPPTAQVFDDKDDELLAKYFSNPDVLWHMEEDLDAEAVEYVSEELPVPDDCTVFVKLIGENKYCTDIYHHITKEWLPLGDMCLICDEHAIEMPLSLGCGKLEEIRAFVASKPKSKAYEGKKMKGVIIKSLNTYKKFYVPIL